ncbi:lanthionine synthetase LanC family protein [Rhizobium rhizogenes]|uniref:lanthionine synthetase LanC family protein n=1 Tax=Rhizobium rhizogenes TaxID=359 RepID=UPI001573D04D|nr:lanthionine synthetase LanC family protein [Rhizobium rhizogenes]NTF46556.1 hypothetical protein [Rhizobium rhizogenes]
MNQFAKVMAEPLARDQLLDAATRIGDQLVRTAYWSNDELACNWLGRRDIEDREIAGYSRRTAALSPELYSGSAGTALYLDALYAETGDARYERTAVAAWLRSVNYMRQNHFPASPISFYAGCLGLLYAGVQILSHTQQFRTIVMDEFLFLTNRIMGGLSVHHSLDVIGGNAGAIPALVHLADVLKQRAFLELASDCAQEIVDKAQWKDDEICLWAPEKVHGVELELPPLSGFSHGASGLALGLLRAYRATGNETFLKHARGAFSFEDALFNPDEGNWIDTRYEHSKRDGKIVGTFRGAWCHGAPGIGLAHLYARELDPERAAYHERMARIAMKTTQAFIVQRRATQGSDITLCHGVLGLSDILLDLATAFDDDEARSCVNATVRSVLGEHGHPEQMPSGLQRGGYSPCLMVGIAGIGLHLLRLRNPGIPSVLCLNQPLRMVPAKPEERP